MVDDLRSDDGLGGFDGHHRQVRRPEKERPLSDREVPLGRQDRARVLSPAVHAWLDGELPEASVRKGDTARDVEFWKQINVEVDQRRRMRTPVYVEARIMDALPQTVPQVITPWWRREFVITPGKAVGAGAALMVAAAIVTAILVAFTQ
jgi:ribosomal protein L18E